MFKSEENDYLMRLVFETPQMSEPMTGLDDQLTISRGVHLKTKFNPDVIIDGVGDLFLISETPTTKSYNLVGLNGEILLYYNFTPINNIKMDYIKTNLIRGHKSHPGIFRRLFVCYFLPQHETIESDEKLTQHGYNFWINLFQKYPQFNYYLFDKHTQTIAPITNIDQIETSYGEDDHYRRFKYIVSSKKWDTNELLRHSIG